MSEIERVEDDAEALAAAELAADRDAPDAPDPEIEAEARKYGWKPKEDFTKNPDGWVPPERYLELPSTHLKMQRDISRELQSRLDRIDATTAEAVRRVRDQEREAYEAKIREVQEQQVKAVETADVEGYTAAKQREQALLRQAPRVEPPKVNLPEWAKDPEMGRFAYQAIEDAPGMKALPVERQLKWAEDRVREMFPDRFPKPEAKTEMRSRVDGGGLGAARRGGKGADDLPAEARTVGAQFVKDGIFPDLSAYAKAYFEQDAR